MICFACPQCHKGFQVEDKLAGRTTKCPKCNAPITIPVPVGAVSSPTTTPRAAALSAPRSSVASPKPIHGASPGVATRAGAGYGGPPSPAQPAARSTATSDPPSGLSSELKIVIGVCGTFSVLVVGFLLWFVAIRDPWESDHRTDVTRLSKETVDLIQAKDSANAVKKYEELLGLVGKRKLNDPELTKAVSDARNAAEPVKRKIDGEQALSTIRGMEAQAKAFVEAGDLERGIEKYQQALDAIKDTHFDNAELAASVGRISQAKTFASAKLEEKRRGEEAERKRAEEEREMNRKSGKDILSCINGWLEDQKKGESGAYYWVDFSGMKTLYAVRSWEILEKEADITVFDSDGPTAIIKVRIESSNKGGIQISAIWEFHMKRKANEWKIRDISGQGD